MLKVFFSKLKRVLACILRDTLMRDIVLTCRWQLVNLVQSLSVARDEKWFLPNPLLSKYIQAGGTLVNKSDYENTGLNLLYSF